MEAQVASIESGPWPSLERDEHPAGNGAHPPPRDLRRIPE
jgi:hypothetical protein